MITVSLLAALFYLPFLPGPLHDAVEKGDIEEVEQLCTKSFLGIRTIKVDERDAFGNTPLHIAANKGNETIARLLLAYGATINAKVKNSLTGAWNEGSTPLHTAALNGHYKITKLLLDRGADKHAQTTQQLQIRGTTIRAGLTPYDIARCRRHTRVANLLIAAATQ